MPLYDPLTDPPYHTRVGHLMLLRESLDRVSERLREGIAESIAHTVAGAVRQAVLTLLAGRQSSPSTTSLSSRVSRDYRTHLWGESQEHLPVDDRDGFNPAWDEPELEPEPAQLAA